jgi:class 3 adenylate cyclase
VATLLVPLVQARTALGERIAAGEELLTKAELVESTGGHRDWISLFASWREATIAKLKAIYDSDDVPFEFDAVSRTVERSAPRFTFPFAKMHLEFGISTLRRLVEQLVFAVEPEGLPETTTPIRVTATVMFIDIVESTERARVVGDEAWSHLLLAHRAIIRVQLDRFSGREIDTAGDGFVATFEVPAQAVRCALAVREMSSYLGLEIRAGLHTGDLVITDDGIFGIAVHLSSRICGRAEAGEVLVSPMVKELTAGTGIGFADRGPHQLKGFDVEVELYAVEQ